MIAALLHGRTHLNFQEFRQQNHLTFFLHVLGVLELLQPQVFQSEHQGALWDCLRSFIRLLLVGAALRARALLSQLPPPLPIQLLPLLPPPWPGPWVGAPGIPAGKQSPLAVPGDQRLGRPPLLRGLGKPLVFPNTMGAQGCACAPAVPLLSLWP